MHIHSFEVMHVLLYEVFLGGCEFTWYSDGALLSELDETDMH